MLATWGMILLISNCAGFLVRQGEYRLASRGLTDKADKELFGGTRE